MTMQPNDRELLALCVRCRSEFTEAEIANASCCPTCGSKGVPADPRKKQTITLTDHEWRILFIWASNWAAWCDRNSKDATDSATVITAIENEARRQQGNLPALSLRAEVQDLANQFGKVEIIEGDTRETIEPERKH